MSRKLRFIIGIAVAFFFIAAWLVVKTFTGNAPGQTCNGDDDCKGMSAVCMIGAGNDKYCTMTCTDNASCPATWTCGDVTVTNIDGHGNTTSGGSTRLCSKP